MPMLTTYLIRHADTIFPVNTQGKRLIYGSEAHLSELGREQMRSLRQRFQQEGVRLDVIFTSPYSRSVESAETLREGTGVPLQIEEELRDTNIPGWIGRPMDDLAEIGGDLYKSPLTDDQDTLGTLISRARSVLKKIFDGKRDQSIGIVSHGDLLSALAWALDRDDEPPSYKDLKDHFYLEKAQACRIEVDEKIRRVGERELITIEGVEGSAEAWRTGRTERGAV